MSALLAGWAACDLGQVASFEMGQAPPGTASNFDEQGTVFVKAGEFGKARPEVREWTTEPLKFARRSDVLICVVGATAGKLNLGIDCAIGRSVAAIRPSAEIEQRFLYYQLLARVGAMRAASSGSAQGVIPKDMLSRLRIVLSPLAEQKRIADKLDTLLARIDACRERLDRTSAVVKRFRQSVISSAVYGDLLQHNSSREDWTDCQLGEALSEVRYGTSKRCDYNGGAHPVLRIPNVSGGIIDGGDIKSADFDADEVVKLALRPGDVLVIRSNGSVDLVGRPALVTEPFSGFLFAGYLLRLRADPKKLDPAFLTLLLSSPQIRSVIEVAARSTSGVHNVNAEELKRLRIRLPSLKLQRAVVAKVDQLFAWAAKLETHLERARRETDAQVPALLAKAFRGELVSQDPNDEPAQDMLARLGAISSSAPGKRAALKRTRGRG